MPLVQQQPRAGHCSLSEAGPGTDVPARLCPCCIINARCFHVADGWGLAGRTRDHDGSVSRSREWWVAPGCSGRAGRFGVFCLFVFFGARSSVWVTLLQIAARSRSRCREAGRASLQCNLGYGDAWGGWQSLIIYRAEECVSCSANTAWLQAGNMQSNSWLNLHTFSVT